MPWDDRRCSKDLGRLASGFPSRRRGRPSRRWQLSGHVRRLRWRAAFQWALRHFFGRLRFRARMLKDCNLVSRPFRCRRSKNPPAARWTASTQGTCLEVPENLIQLKSIHSRCNFLSARRKRHERVTRVLFLYSITSSAVASSPGGTSMPRARAALRLMANSNLVDCSTGRSMGFAPFRMLPV